MKLSDVVSAMQLSIFAEVPLLIFMGVFIGVAAYLLGNRKSFEHLGSLPLRDERRPRHGEER